MEVDLSDRKNTARLAMPQEPLTSRVGNTACRTCLHILTNKLSKHFRRKPLGLQTF